MLRCEAQLELFYILAGLVTVLRFGGLSDRSLVTSSDARTTDIYDCFVFFAGLVVVNVGLSQARLVDLQLLEMS